MLICVPNNANQLSKINAILSPRPFLFIDKKYCDKISEPHIQLFQGAVEPEFLLMNNNAPPHRAHLIESSCKLKIFLAGTNLLALPT